MGNSNSNEIIGIPSKITYAFEEIEIYDKLPNEIRKAISESPFKMAPSSIRDILFSCTIEECIEKLEKNQQRISKNSIFGTWF